MKYQIAFQVRRTGNFFQYLKDTVFGCEHCKTIFSDNDKEIIIERVKRAIDSEVAE